MARLIPRIDPSEIINSGERKVAEALVSQLPNDVEVFHSFNWLRSNSRGTLLEGESDFVVIDPDHGLLFIVSASISASPSDASAMSCM